LAANPQRVWAEMMPDTFVAMGWLAAKSVLDCRFSLVLKMRKAPNHADDPVAGIDRVVLTSAADLGRALETLPEFRTVSDHAMRNLDAGLFHSPYGRARRLVNDRTKTALFVDYKPRFRRMALLRIAVVPEDVSGLRRRELASILTAFAPYRLVIVELRLDFPRRRK
jgi:hypothetical protein